MVFEPCHWFDKKEGSMFTLPLIAPLTGLSNKHCMAENRKLKLGIESDSLIYFMKVKWGNN